MDPVAREYLLRRGYTETMIGEEEVQTVRFGRHEQAGVRFSCIGDRIAFTCRTPSGVVSGVHLVRYDGEKDYQWRSAGSPWLPICYGAARDWEEFGRSGEVVLVEGIFDRAAVARVLDGKAVVARLSKSVATLEPLLRRFARRVWCMFDADDAGEAGARRLARRMERCGVEVLRVRPFGKDAAEQLERFGAARLRRHLDRQMEVAL